ncbi:threonine/serine exporter family protein [Apilactobacillus ozensis]|uniref:Threonine/Serine exporter ThrE domain-containing protein n=1 Tax=Apilactobacillus ozensis DSM 23829 = JCM 17196 TaxID=1423781 RepID=A0A0R2ANI9_9LACO|nr:threonine/serine exporter family protein [Apilactobacillus ozensis]KRM68250.1 hypothetical protein FD06_GL001271 [Apilactobacillus ozensis DSM 23829 = JCM 17196]MCK8606693.1 threonine/serine exporter family protein [Apilactobacillus ozensis]
MQLFFNIILVYLGTIGFGILVNVPKRALNVGGIVSVMGWLIYYFYTQYVGGYIEANALGTFSIGIFGIVASRCKKLPVIIFNIPALVPLVPGGQAYQVMKYLATGNYTLAKSYLIQVVFIAGAIAAGFLFSEFANQLFLRLKKKISIKKKPF